MFPIMHLPFQLAISAIVEVRTLPPGFWGRLCTLCLAGGVLVLIVNLCRAVVRTKKIVLAIVVFGSCSSLLFSWVHNRNEPRVLTPFIDRVSLILSTRPHYTAKQAGDLGSP